MKPLVSLPKWCLLRLGPRARWRIWDLAVPQAGMAGPGRPALARSAPRTVAVAVAVAWALGGCSGSELAGTPDHTGDTLAGLDAGGDTEASADAGWDAAPDTAAEVLTDADASADTAREISGDAASDAAPDVMDATPDGTPDVNLDAGSDATPDVTPDGVGDAIEDAAPDVPLDATPDGAPDVGPDVGPDAGCSHDEDCVGLAGPCLVGTCQAGTGECAFAPADDGTPCDDGNLCSQGETCIAGVCAGGVAVPCQDDNPCTDDVCLPAQGCLHTFNFAPCDDGDACTMGDHCAGGACVGGATPCDDDNPCTVDTCDPATGQCSFSPLADGTSCDDGSECTAGDTCQGGVCAPGPADGCDDGNPCTDNPCAGGVTCGTVPLNGAPCDDGDPCTVGDICLASACVPGPPDPCDDGDPCTVGTCAPPGGCTYEVTPGGACDDGDACTVGDACDAAGACVPGQVADCDDGNPCTADSCDGAQGCLHEPLAGSCPAPNACFTDAVCIDGVCQATPRDCDDGDACTEDACDPVLGCEHVDISAACDDGNPCTLDTCDPVGGCSSVPQDTPCDDGDPCTEADTCASGTCAGTAVDCDDGDPCTEDACTPDQGCVHAAFTGPCDDGDACTEGESCDAAGECGGGAPVDVDDGVGCTVDACDPVAGVTHTPDDAACPVGQVCDGAAGCTLGPIQVVISRVQLLPPGAPSPDPDGQGQWLALTNVGDVAVDLRQTTLATATSGPVAVSATSGVPGSPLVLAPGETMAGIKASGELPSPDFAFVFGTLGDGFALDPAGDTIELSTLEGVTLDVLAVGPVATAGEALGPDEWPVAGGSPLTMGAQALAAAHTAEANDPATAWCAVPGLGPLDPAPDCGRVRLNEVRLGGPDGMRWVELYAPAGATLSGLRVRVLDAQGVGLSLSLVPDGRAPVGPLPLLRDGVGGVILPTLTSGAVQLFQDQLLVDVYGFGTLQATVDASQGLPLYETSPGPEEPPGQAAQRAADGVDTDDNAADWVLVDDGTPGALNGL